MPDRNFRLFARELIAHAEGMECGQRGDAQMQYELFLNTIDDKRAKPTNTEMIALIADILRLEGFEWQISKE